MAMCIRNCSGRLVGSIDIMMVGGLGAHAIAAVGLTNQPKFILLAMIFSLMLELLLLSPEEKGNRIIMEPTVALDSQLCCP